jgi:peptidyl-prolyl cis-trans isomerase D
MIRFLQRDNRLTKALFVVIIAAASVSMVVYLIPGLTGQGATSADTYAVIYPHWYSRFLSSGEVVTQQKVNQIARQQVSQRNPQYADNPMILNFFTKQVGEQLVQQQILMAEANRLGINATTDDVVQYLHTGPTGAVIFPNGKFIGDQQYAALVNSRLNMSVSEFEDNIKESIVIQRLRALVTAGVSVSDQEVRSNYRKDNIKIKFEYAVLSGDELRKGINPSDAELEAFFKKNAARYAAAVPEQRKITYFAFNPGQLPGGIPQPSQQEIQAYYNSERGRQDRCGCQSQGRGRS